MKFILASIALAASSLAHASPDGLYEIKEYANNYRYSADRLLPLKLFVGQEYAAAEAAGEVRSLLGIDSVASEGGVITIELPAGRIDGVASMKTIRRVSMVAPQEDYLSPAKSSALVQGTGAGQVQVIEKSPVPLWTLSKQGEVVVTSNPFSKKDAAVSRVEDEFNVVSAVKTAAAGRLLPGKIVKASPDVVRQIVKSKNYAVVDEKQSMQQMPVENWLEKNIAVDPGSDNDANTYFIKIKSPADAEYVKQFYDKDTFARQQEILSGLFSEILGQALPGKKDITYLSGTDVALVSLTKGELRKLQALKDPRLLSIYARNLTFSRQLNMSTSGLPGGLNMAPTWSTDTGSNAWIAVIDSGVTLAQEQYDGRNYLQACYNTNNPQNGLYSACLDMDASGASPQVYAGRAGGYSNPCGLGSATGASSFYAPDAAQCAHGDSVATVALGRSSVFPAYKGVAYGANLFAINASTLVRESPYSATLVPRMLYADMAKALDAVARQASDKKMVVNISQGNGIGYSSTCDFVAPEVASLIATLKFVYQVPVIIASGNDGFIGQLSAPACFSNTIKVSSVFKEAGNYYYGANIADPANYGGLPGAAVWLAPGVNINIPVNGSIVWGTGTSFAAPHVAGAYALVRSVVPASVSVDDVTQFMTGFFPNGNVNVGGVNYKRLRLAN